MIRRSASERYYGVGLCDGFVTGFEAKEGFGDV